MAKSLEGVFAPKASPERLRHLNREDAEILAGYTKEQQTEISEKLKTLSALAYFIGKDFSIPVHLNKPDEGWHWNFEENFIKIDPTHLLERPMDELRFVMSHEAGHRRISRSLFVPKEVLDQKGFMFMYNALEDPRDNNFVAEAYPRFKDQMKLAYTNDALREAEFREKHPEAAHPPKHIRAGLEYISQWFRESQGLPFEIDSTLPKDVQDVVRSTLHKAQESWWRYPTKEEADASEDTILEYAKAAYEINYRDIWPEFKKLVETDQADQEKREAARKAGGKKEKRKGEGAGSGETPESPKEESPKDEPKEGLDSFEDGLTEDEQKELERFLKGELSGSELSDPLKKKIDDLWDALSEEEKEEIRQIAKKVIDSIDVAFNEALEGKMPSTPADEEPADAESEEGAKPEPRPEVDTKDLRESLAGLMQDKNEYERQMRELLPIIEGLEDELREIFVARHARNLDSGFRSGKRIDMSKRIQEKVHGVSAFESKAWQRSHEPIEKDYAISLLVDLSGSMEGKKMEETFKAVIVLSEVLNKLSIKTEIIGFNEYMQTYQAYGESFNDDVRERMSSMPREVDSEGAYYNDDGWALQEASKSLARQEGNEKFIVVLSDGQPAPSRKHSGPEYGLERVIREVRETTSQKIVGLGIGPGTQHVERYYPNAIANVSVTEMAKRLAELLRDIIAESDTFKCPMDDSTREFISHLAPGG